MSLPKQITNPILQSLQSRNTPEPPIVGFVGPIVVYCGIALCAGATAVWTICTTSSGAKITCPRIDLQRAIRYGSAAWCLLKYEGEMAVWLAQYASGGITYAEKIVKDNKSYLDFLICLVSAGGGTPVS